MEPEFGEEEILELLNKRNNWSLNEVIELVLLKNRIVMLHGELTEDYCNEISKELLFLFYRNVKEVTIILNSVGGEVFSGLLIFNTIEALKKKGMKINVETRGLCASMGVIILVAGTKRTASKYSRFLLHEISSISHGKASEIKEESEELDRLNKMLDEIVSSRSKLTMKKLGRKTKKHDWWFSAEEALEYGLIEEIV
jgi:ATP-dependent Clp protease protease subunit